jgi:tRNA threonylcarbamoyladenosine biosynthesis protein TsaB
LTPRIAVAMDARMDEIYGAVYEFDGEPGAAKQIMASPMGSQEGVAANAHSSGWRMARAPALYALSAWNAVLEGEGAALHGVAGSALEAFGARMPVAAGARTWPRERDRAAALLRLAARAWADGAAVDAAQALPIYLRDKVALTTAERAAARSAAGQPPRGGAEARR